ncbi:S9 family peptidase [Joostella atrarenae]|uniref:S9 family peptidase n=1 Tax=Joostella atrarenae TaxID=679257 RepID=A0ABS9J5Q8_9FLAO|nr:prolyl oligopeptidase family serine peptidase [Joostella atrarenae]MCF8715744.1 S9 family peptidase [Joostella atrarenae]
MKRTTLLSLFLLTSFCFTQAQKNNNSKLSIKQIMQGDNFVGHLPSNAHWSADGKNILFNWNPENAFSDSLYTYNTASETTKKVGFEASYNLPSPYGIYSNDKSKKIYSKNGDVYMMTIASGEIIQITNTQDYEGNVHFTNNEQQIAYVSNKNIYTWDIKTGVTKQITDFNNGKEKDGNKRDEKDEWLYQDQLALFDVLSERKAKKDRQDYFDKKEALKAPLPIYSEGKSIQNQHISPDGKYVSYLLVEREDNKGTITPHYVTESGYTEDQHTRSKVGNEPDTYELFIYDIENRKTYPVALDNLEGLDYIPEYTKDYPDKTYKNDNRIGYISGPIWNKDGSKAVLDINTNDYKDRWIVLLNTEDGTVTNLDHQHDIAWIAGPGIGGYRGGELGWMPDDKSIWFQSEKTGYSHLYTLNTTNKKSKAVTSGDFEIYNPKIANDKKHWYFTANKTHPGDRQFYRMSLNGGKMEQLTFKTGRNDVTLSSDEKQMAILYSYANQPRELYIKENPIYNKNAVAKQVTHSTTKDFEAYDWRSPEFITFKANDGANVHARIYKPATEVKNKGAIIFVHGAGYLQNAHKWWSSYFREYMFHNILVDNGYTVLDIDYRGSAGYGRDWRTGIYRHMGGKDLSDQVDGAAYLVNEHGIDKDKIGIYGGSYGGFITLMGMFNEADTFTAGAAIRSVGDWAAYNHGYTARILNTPTTDSLAYRKSSPIYFADGLEGDLLILHGMVDDNVHFQDMVRLSQKLIELGKTNWEMAVYPVERHGFVEPSSWTDEYTRIFNLFNESLLGKKN